MRVQISVDGLSKSYGPTQALDEVSVDFRGGSVHTVLGENGSGKSTLIKVLSGVVVPDAGSISVDDVPVRRFTPRTSLDLGVVTVFQEILTAPNRSIMENVYLGYSGLWRDRDSQAEQQRKTRELFADLGVPDVDIDAEAGSVPLLVQQVTVIARALLRDPRVLILDEGTAALGLVERDALFETVRRLRADDRLIVFVSHRMDEVMEISDLVTVLRSGRVVGTVDRAEMTPAHLLDLMEPEGV